MKLKNSKVLMIGNGGRESAILIKLNEQNEALELYQWKNNGVLKFVRNFYNEIDDFNQLAEKIVKEHFDLVIIGPEKPIIEGLSDKLRALGVDVFAPSKEGAQLEGSKAFAKKFMFDNGIPTANYFVIENFKKGLEKLKNINYPTYLKASGLAGGKGAVKCENYEEARSTLKDILVDFKYGPQDKVVVEEYLKGKEISMLALLVGEKYFLFPPTRDYKKALDNNMGENTGGMGAISPLDDIRIDDYEKWAENIFTKVIAGLKKQNITYNGVLYAGLMIVDNKPYVLEFNCRFGDPETQVLMQLLKSDLYEMMKKVAVSDDNINLEFLSDYTMTVVLAAKGYPQKYERLIEIKNYSLYNGEVISIPANMRLERGKYFSTGGRVLNVTARDKNFDHLREKIYRVLKNYDSEKFYYRKDIGRLYEN